MSANKGFSIVAKIEKNLKSNKKTKEKNYRYIFTIHLNLKYQGRILLNYY